MIFDFLDPRWNGEDSRSGANNVTWPLDIMSIILSYIDSPADLSRISRVSKIHHYLAIPLLYQEVTLKVSLHPPNRNRFPGACRSPYSAFLSGLKTLQKPGIAGTVKKLVLEDEIIHDNDDSGGCVRESDQARWWETGMWGDLEGLLGLAVGGVVGSMDRLETFVWRIDVYVHPFLYTSLAKHPNLKYLEIRHPKPSLCPPCTFPPRPLRPPLQLIPSMLNLRSLKLLDQSVPPYSDDFTPLIFSSPTLKSLMISWKTETVLSQLVFNQQLRQVLVGRQPKRVMLTELGFMNMFLDGAGDIGELFETTTLERLTLLDCDVSCTSWKELFLPEQASAENPALIAAVVAASGGAIYPRATISSEGSTPTARKGSLDNTPTPPPSASSATSVGTIHRIPPSIRNRRLNLKYFKTNMLGQRYISLLESFEGLEELYFLDPKELGSQDGRDLKVGYLQAIFSKHGKTLKKLRLTAKWILDREEIGRLVRTCSGLVELALGVENDELEFFKVLVPFLTKITTTHIIDSPFYAPHINEIDDKTRLSVIGTALADPDFMKIRWVGLGAQIYKLDRLAQDVDGVRRRGITQMHQEEAAKILEGKGVIGCVAGF